MLKQSLSQFTGDFDREFQDGDALFTEGDDSREMYVIQQGQIVIKKKLPDGSELQLATFNRGDFVGEMALLESLPRFASAYAVGATKVLVLRPGGFLLKIRRDPTFAFEMLQQLSRRIRITNERLLDLVVQGSSQQRETVQEILRNSESRYNEQKNHEPFEGLIDNDSVRKSDGDDYK